MTDAGARRPLLILARSARALAQAARAAGYAPLIVDQFGDADTLAAAWQFRCIPPTAAFGWREAAVVAAVGQLAGGRRPPLVWGGGLEGVPRLLRRLASHCDVLGTPPDALATITDPEARYARLRACDVATPEVAVGRVPRRGRWLAKRVGQAGGLHVREALPGSALGAGEYAQRHVVGRSLSVNFVAGRARVDVLGYAAHLFWPQARAPYAHAGAIGGIPVSRDLDRRIRAALPTLVDAFELRGLGGLDFVLDATGDWWVVDINPRPTATVELLARPASALRAHLAACGGQDWRAVVTRRRPRALAVPYVDVPIRVAKSLDWPAWIADRPIAGARLPRGAPLCSVWADGSTADDALARLTGRLARLRRLVGSAPAPLPVARQPEQR